jgi:beta-barrel assembly-enhancing protease
MLIVLLVWFTAPAGMAQTAKPTLPSLVNRSYLDLLEMRNIPTYDEREVRTVRDRLEEGKKPEIERTKERLDIVKQQLKREREQLADLNKGSSRDTPGMTAQRETVHCRILQLEAEQRNLETEKEKGIPNLYQNKFAKLELIEKWPELRTDIENRIENGTARERRFGNVEDIGLRDLGIEDLAEKQMKDVRMGQEAIKDIKQQGLLPPEVEDDELSEYMQKLGEKIGQNSDLHTPIKVTVLDSDEINAFALPGGFLFVNSGLIDRADTENELVGVMAHEIAHAAARHGARLTKKANIAGMLFQAAQIAALIASGGAVGPLAYYGLQYGFYGLGMIIDLSLLGVSRDYEAEADQLGAQYAWKAGYDPKGFITFFDKMASEEGYVRSTSFFRTHPPFLERIMSTFSEITYLPPKRDLRLSTSAFEDAKAAVRDVIKDRKQTDKNAPSLRGIPEGCELPTTTTNHR